MKYTLIIFYWIASIILLAEVLVSFGYRFMESVFIATLFLPGALAVKYLFPKISFANRKKGMAGAIYITTGIILAEILLFLIAHWYISKIRSGNQYPYSYYDWQVPLQVLVNPIFIAIMIAALAVGNYFFEKWLDLRFPSEEKPVTFLSDRKQVSLMRREILYIESNDSVTTVYATQDRSFRNKTPISQWEEFLGQGFMRIHRSFLVNLEHVSEHNSDSMIVGGTELPVSRKYRDSVKSMS